ncbi:MAG: hypothetical protein CMF25_06250 [Kangiellaceae bacterium]|nr:hypothetical protein [Kangiellaceae bacterium]
MGFKKTALATLIGAAVTIPATVSAEGLEWFGSVYVKFLDGNDHSNNGMYSLGGTYPSAPDGGDQGQAIEFEMLFKSQVSKQVEMGGRLKGRFNRNYWANFGGFGPGDEDGLESAQYFKVRGTYVTVTPGYSWINSITLGSNDFGQFDAWTIGKMRYIDRDNGSGIVASGSIGDIARWDFTRMSLPKLWAGPGWQTTSADKTTRGSYNTSVFAQDAAYALQFTFDGSDMVQARTVFEYVIDEELYDGDDDPSDGRRTTPRVENTVVGGVVSFTGSDMVGVSATYYYSDFKNDLNLGGDYGGGRWTPYINGDESDWAGKLNIDITDIGIDDFGVNFELFRIGADYTSVVAARRESDVLLTEGFEGSFMMRNLTEGSLGIGGFNGAAQQVVTLNVDNEFADFDEKAAQTVIGWQGITVAPRINIADIDVSGEFTYIDYDSNWENFDDQYEMVGESMVPLYPQMEGDSSIGIGSGWRSAFQADQDRETVIAVLKAAYTLDVGKGLNTGLRLKFIDDADNRVTSESRFNEVYASGGLDSLDDDDRDFEMFLFEPTIGYQVHNDLYAKLTYGYYNIDVNDGKVGYGDDGHPGKGWTAPYETGEHERHSLLLQFDYFLPGLEVGSSLQWINQYYDPKFQFNNEQDRLARVSVNEEGDTVVATGLGDVVDEEAKSRQYRMKTWVKVKF